MASDKENFHAFPIQAYVKHGTLEWGYIWPQGYNMENFVEFYKLMLYDRYHGLIPKPRFLDLHLSISNDMVSIKIHDKLGDFDFDFEIAVFKL